MKKKIKITLGIALVLVLLGIQLVSYKIDKINEENTANWIKANAVTTYSYDAKIKANTALLRYIINKEYNVTDVNDSEKREALDYLQKQFNGETYRKLIETGIFDFINVSEDPNILLVEDMLNKEDLFNNGSKIPYYYSKEISGGLSFYEMRDLIQSADHPIDDSEWKFFRGLLIVIGLIINIYLITKKEEAI